MLQNIQSINGQNVNNVQNKMRRNRPTNEKLRGNSRENCIKAKGAIRIEFTQIIWFLW
jgi:hypothetical protein